MNNNWLWDRKITPVEAKKILKAPGTKEFINMAGLLLSRNNNPREIFKNYIEARSFCQYWNEIKRQMRHDKWNEPRIIFWQAIYEKVAGDYKSKGVTFRKEALPKEAHCEAVGKQIAAIRRESGFSQKELAKKIGVSQQVISRFESGSENVSLITLANIARALGRKLQIILS